MHYGISSILGVLCAFIFFMNTLIMGGLIYLFIPFKLLIPLSSVKRMCTKCMVQLAEYWISINSWFLGKVQRTEWEVNHVSELHPHKSYLISSNHVSWVDIPVIQKVLNKKVPFIRFFLKKQLIYVPILGGAWWALDFPFLKRHSTSFLQKHPEKRNEDFKTIRKSCEQFRELPTSILNFLEGTRFTTQKHKQQNSPYIHLLKPKVGGIAFVLDAMGDQFESLLDITIYYPFGTPTLWKLLSGQIKKIVVQVQTWPIPHEFQQGTVFKNDQTRKKIHEWVENIWKNKESLLTRLETRNLNEFSRL